MAPRLALLQVILVLILSLLGHLSSGETTENGPGKMANQLDLQGRGEQPSWQTTLTEVHIDDLGKSHEEVVQSETSVLLAVTRRWSSALATMISSWSRNSRIMRRLQGSFAGWQDRTARPPPLRRQPPTPPVPSVLPLSSQRSFYPSPPSPAPPAIPRPPPPVKRSPPPKRPPSPSSPARSPPPLRSPPQPKPSPPPSRPQRPSPNPPRLPPLSLNPPSPRPLPPPPSPPLPRPPPSPSRASPPPKGSPHPPPSKPPPPPPSSPLKISQSPRPLRLSPPPKLQPTAIVNLPSRRSPPYQVDTDTKSSIETNPLVSSVDEDVGGCPDIQATIDLTNTYRARHSAPDLTWSSDLAAASLAYAKVLAAKCDLVHSRGGGYGENLMLWRRYPVPTSWSTSCSSAINVWYDEVQFYSWDVVRPYTENDFERVGHFTQLVWESTSTFGCGLAVDKVPFPVLYNGPSAPWGCQVVVCRYKAPGNIANDGYFLKNVNPPKSDNSATSDESTATATNGTKRIRSSTDLDPADSSFDDSGSLQGQPAPPAVPLLSPVGTFDDNSDNGSGSGDNGGPLWQAPAVGSYGGSRTYDFSPPQKGVDDDKSIT